MEDMAYIYEVHCQAVYCFLLSKGADSHTAEELTQETFYQAVLHADSYRGDSSIQTWLCGIAKNLWLSHLRRQGRTVSAEEQEEHTLGAAASAEELALSRLGSLQWLKALHRLKEPQREVVYLRLMGGLSFREIAEVMERTETWARVNFYRGKQQMIQEVHQHETTDAL